MDGGTNGTYKIVYLCNYLLEHHFHATANFVQVLSNFCATGKHNVMVNLDMMDNFVQLGTVLVAPTCSTLPGAENLDFFVHHGYCESCLSIAMSVRGLRHFGEKRTRNCTAIHRK